MSGYDHKKRAKTTSGTAERRCLGGCDQLFESRDPGHRICPRCARVRREVRLPRVYRLAGGSSGGSSDHHNNSE
jgi:hypothetical protein